MSEQIPLYLGIPLALLCLGACVFMVTFVLVMWRDRNDE